MKKILEFTKKFGSSVALLGLPFLAMAQGPAKYNGSGTAVPTTGIDSVQNVLNFMCIIFGWAFYFLIALAVVFGVIAAFKYLTSSGESEKVKSAGNTLLYAAIAIAVALLARSIPLIVADCLGSSNGGSAGTIATC